MAARLLCVGSDVVHLKTRCDVLVSVLIWSQPQINPTAAILNRIHKHLPAFCVTPSLSPAGQLSDLVWVCECQPSGQGSSQGIEPAAAWLLGGEGNPQVCSCIFRGLRDRSPWIRPGLLFACRQEVRGGRRPFAPRLKDSCLPGITRFQSHAIKR
jgi:hypothetical protein